MCIIYILTDPRYVDGDPRHIRYVGITTRTMRVRMVEHMRAYTECHRDRWIRVLQRESLVPRFEVIETHEGLTKTELGVMEKYWIAQFKAWGFKLTNGTSGGDGMVDLTPDAKKRHAENVSIGQKQAYRDKPERVEIMRNVAKASWANPESRERRIACITESWKDPETHKLHCAWLRNPESLIKISENFKRLWVDEESRVKMIASRSGPNNWKSRGVIHVASGKEFGSANCAERWLRDNGYPKASGSAVLRACKGKLNRIYGSQWVYVDGTSVEFTPKDRCKGNNHAARAVVCVDTNVFFSSMQEALEWVNRDRKKPGSTTMIWRICNNIKPAITAYGFKWRYATQEEIEVLS